MNVGCLPQVRKLEQWQRDGDFQQSVPWLMSMFRYLPCDDLQHIALLLYGTLPTISDSRRLIQLLLLERFCRRMSAQSGVGWMTLC